MGVEIDTHTGPSSEEARYEARRSLHILPIATYLEKSGGVVGTILDEEPPDGRHMNEDSVPKKSGYITIMQGLTSLDVWYPLVESSGLLDEPIVWEHNLNSLGPPRMPRNILSPRPGDLRGVLISFVTLTHPDLFADLQPFDWQEYRGRAMLWEHYDARLKKGETGEEIFRELYSLGGGNAAVEQCAAFLTYPAEGDAWSGLLLTDVGRSTNDVPWETQRSQWGKTSFGNCECGLHKGDSRAMQSPMRSPNPARWRAPGHHYGPMTADERALCEQSPAAFVADMLKTSALGWNHALDFLHLPRSSEGDDTASRLDILKSHKRFLRRASDYFEEVTRFMDGRDEYAWPVPPTPDAERLDVIYAQLRRDFTFLSGKATKLGSRIDEDMLWEVNEATIRSSQSAVAEGKMMRIVTNLAFIFLPMAFVAGVFGMNVAEFQDGPYPPLWKFFAIAIPVTIASLSVLYGWEYVVRCWAWLKKVPWEATERWWWRISWRWDGLRRAV